MSSHHVVKEKQEPALIIANGESCNSEILGQLLEWSPFIIVLDGAVKRILELGIHFDCVLGDFDSLKDMDSLKKQRPELLFVHTPDQSKTDLEKALDYLIEKEFPAVNILWASGKRLDHTFNNVVSMTKFTSKISWKLIDDSGLTYPVPKSFKKFHNKGTIISLFGIPFARGIQSKNLKYPLNNISLELPQTGSSNQVIEDGLIEIYYSEGNLILMEMKD